MVNRSQKLQHGDWAMCQADDKPIVIEGEKKVIWGDRSEENLAFAAEKHH